MMKYYGTDLCPDCVEASRVLKKRGAEYDYVDITSSTKNLKEFLVLRDTRKEFGPVRKEGLIGIPCFVGDDGSITFKIEI